MCIKSVMLTSENAGVCVALACAENGGRRGGGGGSGGSGGIGAGGEGGEPGNPCSAIVCREGENCVVYGEVAICECDPESDSCAAGFVCDPMELRCRRDGSGGAGGSGGSGTGGSGGGERLPCGDELCRPGEECVDFGVCECDPENSGCHAGFSCSALSRRCEPEPLTMEGGVCANPGSSAGDLVCVQTQSGTGWLRPCTTHADCRLLGTFCPAELDASLPSYCFAIRCGADDPNIAWFGQNGDVFGACDPLHYGVLSETPEGGTCVPDTNSERATCLRDGTSTTTCRRSPLGGFREEYACAPGFSCEQLFEGWGESCNTDADCGKESLLCVEGLCFPMPCRQDRDCGTNSYCSSDRICEPLGACIEICNAGTLGASAGPHADCSGGKVCFEHPYNERSSSSSEILGVCVSP